MVWTLYVSISLSLQTQPTFKAKHGQFIFNLEPDLSYLPSSENHLQELCTKCFFDNDDLYLFMPVWDESRREQLVKGRRLSAKNVTLH